MVCAICVCAFLLLEGGEVEFVERGGVGLAVEPIVSGIIVPGIYI